jgi:excisionase family DNA binding protein
MTTNNRTTKPAAPAAAVARTLDACHYLNISRSTLLRMVKDGRIRQAQIGARARGYLYSDLDAFLASATAA